MDLELYHACEDNINAPRIIALLEAGANINGPVNTDTPLLNAIRAGAIDIITLLVERGADVNAGGGHTNRTPLHLAIFLHMTDIITYLLDHYADVTLTDNNNNTALHYAATHGTNASVTQLLAFGAIVDAKDDQDGTPLHNTFDFYVIGWREKSLQLLANGADINAQDVDGNTSLHHVIHSIDDNIDKVRFLLDHGASVEIQNEKGQTPIDRAVELCALHDDSSKYEAILTLLQEHIASQNVKNAGRRK